MDYFDYDPGDFIPCEITGHRAVDISHNKARGMGGRKSADSIENLMALTRGLHNYLESNPSLYQWFQDRHLEFMGDRVPYLERSGAFSDPVVSRMLLDGVVKYL